MTATIGRNRRSANAVSFIQKSFHHRGTEKEEKTNHEGTKAQRRNLSREAALIFSWCLGALVFQNFFSPS
jgi:hypothetical protein